ncbi:High-affinity glucose transporter RGT2 [Colletotrichum gloeosporioides]|uniref:High-affinity glucose transporter RGT2 n=1 Tax=Colletotrichum gloeosporioides TaxID=474922 RepID=A0A8H4CT84_COLGL|nr:High-affinity glucose transporter RGT2 [Colletotrichum gloeosporioides]KAF3809698.1 High-affinity glucose transporter RGT2 [Colletotrichum gloeosporioides]
MRERRPDGIRANWRCFVACGMVVLSPFQYGVDFGIIGGLQAMPGFLQVYGYEDPKTSIGWNISTTRQQLISSLMTLGAFISSMLAGAIASKLSRKMCLWLSCVLCVVANVIMMTTTHIGALYVGRLLIGLGNGGFMTFSQLYIQETSPAKYRGLFMTGFQFCVTIGTLLGTIIDWATAQRPDKSAYLIPLGVVYAVPVVIAASLFFIPESPRWLIMRDRIEEGRKALVWLRPTGVDVEDEVNEIRGAVLEDFETKKSVTFWDMFKDPIDRRRTIISICAVCLQSASGSMFIIAYKAYFFTIARVEHPFAMTNVLSTCGLLAIIANALVVVRYGRRRVFLLTGLVLSGCFQLIMAITFDKHPNTVSTGNLLVAISCLFMIAYNGMIAPYSWMVAGEAPSQRLRSYTLGVASAAGYFLAWLITFTAPYFINPSALNWGPRYGYIWFPSCIISAVWTYFYIPELKGRTLEEINQMFHARLSARKFRQFQSITISRKTSQSKADFEGIKVEMLDRA